MSEPEQACTRRLCLLTGAAALLALSDPLWAQAARPPAPVRSLVVGQLVDFSQDQQDVSKDFLIGSRAAWQDINARGGIRGRKVEHLALETDGTSASVHLALDSIRDNAACIALSGTVGDNLATQMLSATSSQALGLAQVAPWLQTSGMALGEQTFPIFSARQEQIAYALKTFAVMGLKELGAVYASRHHQTIHEVDLQGIASGMKLKLQSFQGDGELRALGQRMTGDTPAVLLFIGGTPELAEFTQGLTQQARQRYLVALADVNLQTVMQMGAARSTPVIATQPVPAVNSNLPVVRHFREVLTRLFDEPPTALGLAGFIAARYTFEVIADMDGNLTRSSVLAAFQRRAERDVGGFRVAFDAQRRSSQYVTQTMLSANGRVIG